MKQLLATFFYSFFLFALGFSQNQTTFSVVLEEQLAPNLPRLQSYVLGESDEKWLVVGGRKDGLHRRQPFAAFDEAGRNEQIYVLDPSENKVWSAPIASLGQNLAEQLQSSNMEFHQEGNNLYIIGGYGYAASVGEHITFPNLTVVDISGAISAVMNGTDLAPHFRQIEDDRLRVTGGYLGKLGSYFYLAGGQNFMGSYNPMGPSHGPGFFQAYTDEIRKFKISDDGQNLILNDYSTWHDSLNLHRRDYNMVPQIFPNGKRGFTMFSGVFQHDVDLPWLNTVDFDSTDYTVKNDFEQLLNQYHSAHLALYDSIENQMHTLFFGGISRFRVDDVTGLLIDDMDVPFVKTISQVTRFSDGEMKEIKIGEMPSLMGTSAEFIPSKQVSFSDGILNLNTLSGDTAFVGYILGGIKSSQANIFFINTGAESEALNRLYKVSIIQNISTTIPEVPKTEQTQLEIIPNPFRDDFKVAFEISESKKIGIRVLDSEGKQILKMPERMFNAGEHQLDLSLKWFPSGVYSIFLMENGREMAFARTIKQ